MNSSLSAASSLKALAANIDAALPQTQCTRCGYPDCASYAQAIAYADAAINQCPPGGQEGVRRLASITGRPELPLNAENGLEAPRALAVIDEAWCIGCTLCIKACPTDAILGANKRMHTVIAEHCTGCELCIPVCPVDCIELANASGNATGWSAWSAAQAEHARGRYDAHLQRTGRKADAPVRTTAQAPEEAGAQTVTTSASATDKKAAIAAILAKAKAQRARV
ncbi:MAG: RnfABCDGE type electron transport complex subunit B [Comamonas sp.]|jgi:electron transport complex protein RnfB|uniref:RnfABCDGE type electron transport complex subunit B n=1 Tax=Comamonas sp. TaxID=34028 RepID=UPI00284EECF6|nr:RnfABCDGE type electron transport complex subunit B [Comamonas sp.]MDR3064939.1 RnfABCDGE type electron transport complex subunit B [Comamonas sp.]